MRKRLRAFALAAALALPGAGSGALAASPAPPLVVVAIDGADWNVVRRMSSEGRLPAFAALMQRGASGRVEAFEPLAPAMLWTSLWTGAGPEAHGVYDPAPSWLLAPPRAEALLQSRIPYLWDMADGESRRAVVLGWPEGLPASTPLTHHPLWRRMGSPEEALPLGEVSGAERAARLRRIFRTDKFPVPEESVWEAVASTEAVTAAARRSLGEKPGALFVFYPGMSAASFLFMDYGLPRMPHVDARGWFGVDAALEKFYEFQDSQLTLLLESILPGSNVAVVSAYGCRSRFDRVFVPRDRPFYEENFHRQSPDGFLIAAGPSILSGVFMGYDIYRAHQTLCKLLGLEESAASDAGPRPPLLASQAVTRFLHLLSQKESVAAIEQARRGKQAYPREPFWRYAEGLAWQRLRRLDRALFCMEDALRLRGDFIPAYVGAANVLKARMDTDGAVRLLRSAIENHPGEPPLRNALGKLLYELGDYERAKGLYQTSRSAYFGQAEAHAMIALCEARMGLVQQAMDNLASPAFLHEPFGRLARAEIAMLQRHDTETLAEAEAMEAEWPGLPQTYLWKGRALWLLGRKERALEAFEKAAICGPRLPEPRYYRAMLLWETGKRREAFEDMKKLALEQGDSPELFARTGAWAFELGDLPRARDFLGRALALDPVHPEARKYRSLLNEE
jgi:tetratricopeptide (TPR) repeat protein